MKIFYSLILVISFCVSAYAQTQSVIDEAGWKTVYTFSGSSSENTDDFTIKGSKWRILWEANKQYDDFEGGNLFVFLVDSNEDEECIVNSIPTDKGKSIIRKKGTFYFKIQSFIVAWKIEVQEYTVSKKK